MKQFLILILFVFCIGSVKAFGEESLKDLKTLDELQKQFNSDAGKVRLVALLSPT